MIGSYYPIEDYAQAQVEALHRRSEHERLVASLCPSLIERVKEWIGRRLDLRVEPQRAPAVHRL